MALISLAIAAGEKLGHAIVTYLSQANGIAGRHLGIMLWPEE